MPRTYEVPFNFSYTAAGGNFDVVALRPAADKPIRLKALRMGQLTEVGDAQEENLEFTVRRFGATVTNGSGGSAPTPIPTDDGDAAAGFTARVGDATVATTSGTNELKSEIPWNERNNAWETAWPDPADRPTARGTAAALILRGETTAADDLTLCGTLVVEEL